MEVIDAEDLEGVVVVGYRREVEMCEGDRVVDEGQKTPAPQRAGTVPSDCFVTGKRRGFVFVTQLRLLETAHFDAVFGEEVGQFQRGIADSIAVPTDHRLDGLRRRKMRTRTGVSRTRVVVVVTTLRRARVWVNPTDEEEDEDEGCSEDVGEGGCFKPATRSG